MTFRIEPRIHALHHLATRIQERANLGPAHQALFGQVVKLGNLVETLGNLHSKRDPTMTEGAHVKRVASAAAQLERETAMALERMNAAVHQGAREIEKRIAAKVHLVPDHYATEIRDVFRRLPTKDGLALLNQLVEENRGPELAAIVNAPRSTTNLDEELRTRYSAAIVERHAPQEHDEQRQLMESFHAALTALDPAKDVAAAYSNPQALAEITRAEQAAAQAARAFKEATQNEGA